MLLLYTLWGIKVDYHVIVSILKNSTRIFIIELNQWKKIIKTSQKQKRTLHSNFKEDLAVVITLQVLLFLRTIRWFSYLRSTIITEPVMRWILHFEGSLIIKRTTFYCFITWFSDELIHTYQIECYQAKILV